MTNVDRYPAQVFWSDEDEGFVAIAPDLPGCSAFGETQPEALAELQDAIAAWIEAARAAGNPIPEPSDPAREADYSGKVLLRMPRDLHARLATLAKIEAVSLNQYLVFLLTLASTNRSFELSTSGISHPRVGGTTAHDLQYFDAGFLRQPVKPVTACLWQQTTGGQQFRAFGAAVPLIVETGNMTIRETGNVAITGGGMIFTVGGKGTRTITGGGPDEALEREGRHG